MLKRVLLSLTAVVSLAVSLASSPVWTQVTGDPAGWKESPWFGWFSSPSLDSGWAYSYEHGDIWIHGPSESDLWIWDYELGWMWTSRHHYPYIYVYTDASWMLYLRQSLFPRWYYHFGYNIWTQVGSGYPAPRTTTPEEKMGSSATSMPALVSLSDGTAVEMPPLGATVPFTVGRESTGFVFSSKGLQTSGATRTLVIEPTPGLNPDVVTPRIIFPLSQKGSFVSQTINVLRVESVPDGEGGTRERTNFLPVTYHADGTFSARDFLMPETVRERQATANAVAARSAEGAWESVRDPVPPPTKVRYVACSFNGSLNYKRTPMLQRMIPTRTAPFRVPYSNLPSSEREKADTIVPHNVVVLVHGHNEEEKGGIYETSAPWPWLFAYKRDVWTILYQVLPEFYFTTPADANSYLSPEHTTHFYEYVYPSYRAIFNDLDIQLARQLEAALAPQLNLGMPINVVIIAHSMGGIVSRAAIQQFSDRLNDRFMDLMTWGTPHMGSPLVSLRYAMGADLPYDFAFEDAGAEALLAILSPSAAGKYKFGVWALKHVLRIFADSAQLDTPGTRDLRYVRRPMQEGSFRLGLENLFKLSSAQSQLEKRPLYDLQNGSWIYNYNLQILNQNDRHAGSDKYFPVVGTTERRIAFKESDDYPWILVDAILGWDPGMVIDNLQYETAAGATLMPLLVANPHEETLIPTRTSSLGTAGQSDGAANIPSMAAYGVSKWVGTAPGWDHEEYYGSPKYSESGEGPTITARSKGRGMAKFALERMVGGNADPNRGYDRYGVMQTPRFGYRLAPGANLSPQDGITVNNVATTSEFEMIGNLRFHELDELYEYPFDYIKPDGVRIVSDPDRPVGQPVSIPVTDLEIGPTDLPIASPGTSGSFISISEYAENNPRLFRGKVDIGGIPIANKILRTEIEFIDGSVLTLPPSFIIYSPSPAGTWKLTAQASNGNYSIEQGVWGNIEQLPVDLNSGGQGSFTTEYEEIHDVTWDTSKRTGFRYERQWYIEGTVSMVNNQFVLNMVIEFGEVRDSFTDRWIDGRFRYVDVRQEKSAVLTVTHIATFAPSLVVGETWTFTPVSSEGEWEVDLKVTESIDGGGGQTDTTKFSGTTVSASGVLNR